MLERRPAARVHAAEPDIWAFVGKRGHTAWELKRHAILVLVAVHEIGAAGDCGIFTVEPHILRAADATALYAVRAGCVTENACGVDGRVGAARHGRRCGRHERIDAVRAQRQWRTHRALEEAISANRAATRAWVALAMYLVPVGRAAHRDTDRVEAGVLHKHR